MAASPFPSSTSARSPEFDMFGSIRSRALASIAAIVGWLSLVLLYVGFWAHEFSLFQSVIVFIVSLLVLGAVLMGAWVSFGLKFVKGWTD